MRVLIACEESQTVTKAFRALGHEAYSCDLQECSGGHPEWHIQGNVINEMRKGWDLIIAHPPCTRLANSGVRWLAERDLWDEVYFACEFFNVFQSAALNGTPVCIENPIPHKHAIEYIGKYTQLIQPYQFGHLEKKATCLWLYNLPNLIPTNNVYEEMMKLDYKDRAKVHYASPGVDRAKIRSKTFPGIANPMERIYNQTKSSMNYLLFLIACITYSPATVWLACRGRKTLKAKTKKSW